jgi:hypothetical protein
MNYTLELFKKNIITISSKLPFFNYIQKKYREYYTLSLKHLSVTDRQEWLNRIELVLECPDLKSIPLVNDAGKIKNGYLIMHNGVKIEPLSYYGYPMLKLFKKTKGIHEPQEERIFAEVLKVIPKGSIMVELGSYWGFYSMWFNKKVTDAKNFLIEPTDTGLDAGQKNFRLNSMHGDFTQAFIGKKPGYTADGVKIINIDTFVKEKELAFLDILHADIQGYELEMLKGASECLAQKKIGYTFISTHSNDLHNDCINMLKENCYKILTSINMDETYSVDGLIVACSPKYYQISKVELSKRSF